MAPANYEDVVSSAMERGAARPAASPIRHRFLASQEAQEAAPAQVPVPAKPEGPQAAAKAGAASGRARLNLNLPPDLYRRVRTRSVDLLVEGRPRSESSMSRVIAAAVGELLDEIEGGWEPGEGLLAPAGGQRANVSVYLPRDLHARLRRLAVGRACDRLPYSSCVDLVSLAILRHVPEGGGDE